MKFLFVLIGVLLIVIPAAIVVYRELIRYLNNK